MFPTINPGNNLRNVFQLLACKKLKRSYNRISGNHPFLCTLFLNSVTIRVTNLLTTG